MIWLRAALDLATAVYLLRRALPRQRRDRDLMRAVGLMLLCAALLIAIAVWRAADQPPEQPSPSEPRTPGVRV